MVQQVSRRAPGEERVSEACRHHWIIEAPMGPVSNGVCQVCKEVREFKNYIETAPWAEDSAVIQLSGQFPAASSSEDVEEF